MMRMIKCLQSVNDDKNEYKILYSCFFVFCIAPHTLMMIMQPVIVVEVVVKWLQGENDDAYKICKFARG